MEDQLSLQLVGRASRYLELNGEVSDQPGIGNLLHFTSEIGQSHLEESIRELEQVMSQFPKRV